MPLLFICPFFICPGEGEHPPFGQQAGGNGGQVHFRVDESGVVAAVE